jgi:hypothetical protein
MFRRDDAWQCGQPRLGVEQRSRKHMRGRGGFAQRNGAIGCCVDECAPFQIVLEQGFGRWAQIRDGFGESSPANVVSDCSPWPPHVAALRVGNDGGGAAKGQQSS